MPRTRPVPPCDRTLVMALWPIVAWLGLAALAGALAGCAASGRPIRVADLGQPSDASRLEAQLAEPGPIRFERVAVADWAVPLSGLLNLDHPRARAAGLEDRSEPIELFLHVLDHPTEGVFLVDSGVSRDFARSRGSDDVSWLVESVMDTASLDVHVTTADWIAAHARSRRIEGVFLTHIHLDHIMGLSDLARDTPVYVGPGETRSRAFLNLFTRGTLDRLLGHVGPLREWPFPDAAEGRPGGVLDVFGDGSLFALHVPGHTPGSMAFLVRSTDGPKLLVGDTSHTRWGWENGVEPGAFTADHARNAESLAWLRALAERHPGIEVHLGHQRLDAPTEAPSPPGASSAANEPTAAPASRE